MIVPVRRYDNGTAEPDALLIGTACFLLTRETVRKLHEEPRPEMQRILLDDLLLHLMALEVDEPQRFLEDFPAPPEAAGRRPR